MLPLAPDLFSATTCWPQISERWAATIRAVASIPPPAASGQTMRTNCVGHLSACAASGRAVAAIAIPLMKSRRRMRSSRSLRPRQSQFVGYHTCRGAGSARKRVRKGRTMAIWSSRPKGGRCSACMRLRFTQKRRSTSGCESIAMCQNWTPEQSASGTEGESQRGMYLQRHTRRKSEARSQFNDALP